MLRRNTSRENTSPAPAWAGGTRGFGIQIDLLTGATVYIAAWVLFLTLSVGVLGGLASPATADRVAAERAADSVADDLLVSEPNAVTLDRSCTEAFFGQKSPGGCGFDSNWGAGSASYLESALSLNTKQINIQISDTSGSVQSINGQQLAIGTEVPADNADVEGWERQGTLDYNDDGTAEWVIIDVRVW